MTTGDDELLRAPLSSLRWLGCDSGSYRPQRTIGVQRNLLQLQFNKLDPAVTDIPQGASGICILPEEIPSLQVYLAIELIWRTFCQDASAYDDADTRRLLCDCGNGSARIEHQSPAANTIIDLHFVFFDVSTRGC